MSVLFVIVASLLSCCNCQEVRIDGICVRLIENDELDRILTAAITDTYSVIDKELSLHIIPGRNELCNQEIRDVLAMSTDTIVKSSNDDLHFQYLMREFCDRDSMTTLFQLSKIIVEDLDSLYIDGTKHYFQMEKVKIEALKARPRNTALNRFYINSNRVLDMNSKKITLFMSTKVISTDN